MEKLLLINDHENSNEYLVALYNNYTYNKDKIYINDQFSVEDLVKHLSNCTDVIYNITVSDAVLMSLFAKALSKIDKSLNVFIYHINLKTSLEQLLTMSEQYYIGKTHKLFEISNVFPTPIPIVFTYSSDYADVKSAARDKSKRYDYTGRFVQILDLVKIDLNLQNLSKNYIVNEIDCSDIDSTDEGVWVYGTSFPVKLINRNNIKEFELLSNISVADAILLNLKYFSNIETSSLKSMVDDVLTLNIDVHMKCSFMLAFANIRTTDTYYKNNLELLIIQHTT